MLKYGIRVISRGRNWTGYCQVYMNEADKRKYTYIHNSGLFELQAMHQHAFKHCLKYLLKILGLGDCFRSQKSVHSLYNPFTEQYNLRQRNFSDEKKNTLNSDQQAKNQAELPILWGSLLKVSQNCEPTAEVNRETTEIVAHLRPIAASDIGSVHSCILRKSKDFDCLWQKIIVRGNAMERSHYHGFSQRVTAHLSTHLSLRLVSFKPDLTLFTSSAQIIKQNFQKSGEYMGYYASSYKGGQIFLKNLPLTSVSK